MSFYSNWHVRALHQELHVAANPGAVSADRSGSNSQYAAELQRLPDRPRRYRGRTRRQPRAGAGALGTGSVLVEQAAEGIAPRHVQRPHRDSHHKAVLPRTVQAQAAKTDPLGARWR